MQLGLRFALSALVLFLTSACMDAPTIPVVDPAAATPSRIGVWSPGDSGKCDPWQDINWCEGDPGDGSCITSNPPGGEPEEHVRTAGCVPGGSGGDGGDDDGKEPQPPDPDTCQTGDPVLDDPAVKAGLKDLWTRSNPGAAQAQRLEQAAWIIQNPDGSFAMAPFVASLQGPCGINGNFNPPPGAVAWVHTHPFTRNEVQTSCGPLQQRDPATGLWRNVVGANGQPVYPIYRNRPSGPDREMLRIINAAMANGGRDQLAGVIMDVDQTTVYTENSGDKATRFPRCGY